MSEFNVGDRVKVRGSDVAGVVTTVAADYSRVYVLRDGEIEPLYWLPERLDLVCRAECAAPSPVKHSHYFKPCPFDHVDAYRLILMLEITDPCLQHAFKKIAFAGGRLHKDTAKDVQEAIDSLVRWQAMRAEEAAAV